MENINKVFFSRKNLEGNFYNDEHEIRNSGEPEKGPCLIEKEMGIHRRKRRSLQGRDFQGKIPIYVTTLNNGTPKNIYASCLEINDENFIETILEDCTNVEEMIKKLKEQRISLTKKRCIKAKLKPVEQSKIVKLSWIKKLKYRIGISYDKLIIGCRNFLYTFELWYNSLKMIEGKFGSSVAAYFKFLRKLFILNCLIFIVNFLFIILPQVLYAQFSRNIGNMSILNKSFDMSTEAFETLKYVSVEEDNFFFFSTYSDMSNSNMRLGNLFTGMEVCGLLVLLRTAWGNFQGYLPGSVLFYGHYLNSSFSLIRTYSYDMPSAYFFSIALCYFLVLCVLFFSVADSYKKYYIETSGGGQNVFAEKIFCGWDFGIAKRDAEELKYCSIYMELKELLNESSNRNKSKSIIDAFYTMMIRLSLNLILLLLLITLGWYTSTYLDLHMDNADVPTIMMLMLILTLVITLAPAGFSWLAKFEYYESPRAYLYVTLVRTFILHVLIIMNIVAHRISSASKISCWETVVGQDVYRLVILDFFVGIGDNMIEFIRFRISRIWERVEQPEFNIAFNTMNLIYNQALLYVGLYFSPGLSLIVSFKMFLTFYLKKWGAMYNCQPSKKPWRAAQTKTVFLSFTFLVFFGIIIGYGYVFTSVKTSSCGPFGGGKIVFEAVLYEILHEGVNSTSLLLLSHFLRSGVVVLMLLAMILAIYYLRSVNAVRRHIVENLRLIVKEQVLHKKKLLMRIQKAEEYKNSIKEKRHSVINLPSMPQHPYEDSSSDLDDRGEDFPLKKQSESSENYHSLRTSRLSQSTYNLMMTEETYGFESGKKRISSKSLQSLHPGSTPSDFISEVNRSSIHRADTSIEKPGEEDKYCSFITHNENEADCDDLEVSPLHGQYFNYDERIPSRIYFDRTKIKRK